MRSVGDGAALPHLDWIAVAEHKAGGEVRVVERPGGIPVTRLAEHDPIPGPPDERALALAVVDLVCPFWDDDLDASGAERAPVGCRAVGLVGQQRPAGCGACRAPCAGRGPSW